VASGNAFAIDVLGLNVAYREQRVLRDVNWQVPAGVLLGIVGPNGAGKSTLIKALLGLVPRQSGTVTLLGQTPKAARARIAYVPQRTSVDWDFPTTVADVVAMGTYGRLGWFRRPGRTQWAEVDEALAQVGMSEFGSRQIRELSGGQQQRTFLARALVQKAELYVLDEPLQGVDIVTESTIIGLLKSLRDRGRTIVVVHHDLSTVAEYFDSVTLLNGTVIASGPVRETFTADAIAATYGRRIPVT
jgi:manganese/zinc/iron transport system ATP- binding protein